MQTPAAAPVIVQPGSPAGPAAEGNIVIQLPQRPLTARDIAGLRARRTELSNQLESADSRRNRLAEELRTAPASERPGLQARLDLLDRRILQIESDIAETGRQLSSARADVVSTTAPPRTFAGFSSGQATALSIVSVIFVLGPLAVGLAYSLWRRANRPPPPPQDTARLERIEQAVDAIAIEVERISEGQRFVTRIIAEQQGLPALGAGERAAEAIPIRQAEGIRRG